MANKASLGGCIAHCISHFKRKGDLLHEGSLWGGCWLAWVQTGWIQSTLGQHTEEELMLIWSQWTTCWDRVGDTSSHHWQSYWHGNKLILSMPEAMISYLLGIGISQSKKHSYSFEDARILFYCYASASYAVLLSLTTSCAATCQSQPASSERRLALLEREGHGLPVKVEYVGTAGQQPCTLQYGWRPGSAQEKLFGVFFFWSK